MEGESLNSRLISTLTKGTGLGSRYCEREELRIENIRVDQGKRGALEPNQRARVH